MFNSQHFCAALTVSYYKEKYYDKYRFLNKFCHSPFALREQTSFHIHSAPSQSRMVLLTLYLSLNMSLSKILYRPLLFCNFPTASSWWIIRTVSFYPLYVTIINKTHNEVSWRTNHVSCTLYLNSFQMRAQIWLRYATLWCI
jgi:hypothetical protein